MVCLKLSRIFWNQKNFGIKACRLILVYNIKDINQVLSTFKSKQKKEWSKLKQEDFVSAQLDSANVKKVTAAAVSRASVMDAQSLLNSS